MIENYISRKECFPQNCKTALKSNGKFMVHMRKTEKLVNDFLVIIPKVI